MADNESKRTIRATFLLNKEEAECIGRYLSKYRITNKSRWIRETLMSTVIDNLVKDYPTLFDEQDMRR